MALAVVESMSGSRPIGQLNRWVADEVLTAVFLHQRRRRSAPRRVATPPVLHSVRVQHPEPDVAEVSAHVRIQERSMALAFRLEAVGERWLCTALELGPRA